VLDVGSGIGFIGCSFWDVPRNKLFISNYVAIYVG